VPGQLGSFGSSRLSTLLSSCTSEHLHGTKRIRDQVAPLLNSADPSVRYFTLVELLGAPDDSLEVQEARRNIPKGPRVQALLKGQRQDGSFGVSPYSKWSGAHWRLVSLVELGVLHGDPRVQAAIETVLQWLTGDKHRVKS
jgi:hypothetical protein